MSCNELTERHHNICKLYNPNFELFRKGFIEKYAVINYKLRIGFPLPIQNPSFAPSPEMSKELLREMESVIKEGSSSRRFYTGKQCILKNWNKLTFDNTSEEQIHEMFADHTGNLAISMGHDNIICIDFDNLSMYDSFYSRNKDIIDNTPVEQSGNGYHIIIRVKNPIWNSNKAISYNGERVGELRGKGGYIVTHPSIHHTGFEYQWIVSPMLHDVMTVDSLEELGLSFSNSPVALETQHSYIVSGSKNDRTSTETNGKYRIVLPTKYYRITQGNFDGYKSRSEAEASLIAYCVTRDYSKEDIKELLDNICSTKTKYKNECFLGNYGYFERTFESAVKFVTTSTERKHEVLDNAIRSVLDSSWGGITGATDQKVIIAILRIARRAMKITDLRVSQRSLVEEAGVGSRKTVISALKRLQLSKCLSFSIIFSKEKSTRITNIDLNLEEISQRCHSIPPKTVMEWDKVESDSCSADLYRHRGLGLSGLRILKYIRTKECFTVKDIAENLFLKSTTVRRKLKKMILCGFVIRISRCKYCKTEKSDLALAETRLKVFGRGRKIKGKHAEERAKHKMYLDRAIPP